MAVNDTVGERIRFLRKEHLDLTLKEMSERLNVSLSNLGNVETGKINATDRLLSDICREYGVSIVWLETGDGEIFKEKTEYERLAAFFGDVLNDQPESFRITFLSSLAELDDNGWAMLQAECEMKSRIYDAQKKKDSK
jgi:transcriptional regulator with XRE-family HTH domain